jgi:hypothetical protein
VKPDGGDDQEQPETGKKRKIAAIVVGISVLGLLFLSGALTAIFKWVLGAAFIAGVLGGGWYLVKNRVAALRASMAEKKIEAPKSTEKPSLEDQLAELKRKKGSDKT